MYIPTELSPLGMGAFNSLQIPLTLTATQANSTIKLTKTGSPTVFGLSYRVNGGPWHAYTIDDVITLQNVGDYVQFWNTEETLSTSGSNYVQYVMTGRVRARGNIQSLFNYSDTVPAYGFYFLFGGCTALVTSPELPAKSIAQGCYMSMFEGCTSLEIAPNLPATSAANVCYYRMFVNCFSLINPPTIALTTVASTCCYYMFSNCTSLTTMPTLHATTMQPSCYYGMFSGCTALTNVSNLLATTLANNCYQSMFYGCTSLVNAPALPATTLSDNCYKGMFAHCISLTTAPDLPATSLANYCYYEMFRGCSLIDSVSVNFTDWSNTGATTDWLTGTAATGTFICPDGLTIPSRDGSGVPENWDIVRKIQYLESTGTQYIDTLYSPNPNTLLELTCCASPDYTYGGTFFDVLEAGETSSIRYQFSANFGNSPNAAYGIYLWNDKAYQYGGSPNSIYVTPGDKIRTVGTITFGRGYATAWGQTKNFNAETTRTFTRTLYLFSGMNINGAFTEGIKLRVYEFKIYDVGMKLTRDFIPVLDNNNVPCMYDCISEQLFYNQGSGTFNYA